jgi:hypothetical protein
MRAAWPLAGAARGEKTRFHGTLGIGIGINDALAALVPFPKRLGEPHDYAALAEFMVMTRYFNGKSVRLDGGMRMAPRQGRPAVCA